MCLFELETGASLGTMRRFDREDFSVLKKLVLGTGLKLKRKREVRLSRDGSAVCAAVTSSFLV
jgi:hypothetical protein